MRVTDCDVMGGESTPCEHASLPETGRGDWRTGLPTLVASRCKLREVALADAPSLLAHLNTAEVAKFIPPPPASVEAFEDFVRWAHVRRQQGRYACFGIVPAGGRTAVGVFQIHVAEDNADVAGWGFAMGQAYWGSGIFPAGADQIREFAFRRMGVQRLEARSAVQNGRGNGALRKIGATPAGVLKAGFDEPHDLRFDMARWVLTGEDQAPAASASG